MGRLTLGWDKAEDLFLVKLNKIKHSELEKFIKEVQICRQKIVRVAEGNVR